MAYFNVCLKVISAFRTVYSFAKEDFEIRKYTERINEHFLLNVKQVMFLIMLLVVCVSLTMGSISIALVQVCIQAVYYMFCNTFLIGTCIPVAVLLFGRWVHPKM